MKLVQWTDEDGFNRQSWLRDKDPDDEAIYGIPLDPPNPDGDISLEVRRDLHNELMARNLITWADVQAQQSGVTGTVEVVARRHNLDRREARKIRRLLLIAYRR